MAAKFILISPATRGISLALTRHYLQHTTLPVYATHRSSHPEQVRGEMLRSEEGRLLDVDPSRLHLLRLDLSSEADIEAGAKTLLEMTKENGHSHVHTVFLTGGMLNAERRPEDLDATIIHDTFNLNVISHLLMIKHFSRFLPQSSSKFPANAEDIAKWVHISARVGSISDNRLGGWYSYRASKAALNQVIRTFDLHLKAKKIPAISIGVHPGTVKTDLSKPFWEGVEEGKLFSPEFAAERLVQVVGNTEPKQRGKVWDWAGVEVPP
ncbi:hypothetical protein NLI96_g341 [Meripilus lineatus]|uniref:NAD(P)-binding protein n=1 Tax=Meripilus lineatus TaxID=2056292 RepID=A0AAD5YNY9_9APHY|nr:hypothetical protein NLI96_g341 [Physisporinus lineatus]